MLVNKSLSTGILSAQLFLCSPPLTIFFFNLRFLFACSSGDSQGVSPGDQKARYDEVAKKRPSTILSLQHEVHGMFFYFLSLPLINVNSFPEFFFFFFCRFQSPACKSFNSGSFFVLVDTKIRFTDMTSFHTRSKFFKRLDTSWLQLLNVLGNNPTLAWVILPHEMYVFCYFLPAYFDLFWVAYLALLSV